MLFDIFCINFEFQENLLSSTIETRECFSYAVYICDVNVLYKVYICDVIVCKRKNYY